jgi:ATP-dependent helicase/nuclease subunit A
MQSSPEERASSDAPARERALDPHLSISLEAPAGSGKTGVLVQRFLRLLATVGEPEEILAITFTRKAAGEMRGRLVRALREGEGFPEEPVVRELARVARERSSRLGWALEANPGRLRIQTIDALNRSLAVRLPLAAGGVGESEITDQPRTLYAAAARRALLDAEGDAELQADAELLFGRLDNDFGRFERLLTEMLAARAHWLPRLLDDADLCARVEESLRSILTARLSEARVLIPGELIEEGARLAAIAADNRERAADRKAGPGEARRHPRPGEHLTLRHWQGLAHLALTHQGNWRKVFTLREGCPSQDRLLREQMARWLSHLSSVRGARELLLELARLPHPELEREDAGALTALARLLRLAASELEVLFRETGRADHTAVAAAARQALTAEGSPTDLALRLGEDLRHILVDEFQDTSIEQVRLLEALTATWEDGDGRTLFVVGDPMQSIYQFREAEVGLFLRASVHGVGALQLQPLALTRNFRSAPELVTWTNRIFPQCFPQVDDARASAVHYRPSIAARVCAHPGVVRWHATRAGDTQAEARAIADLVAQLQSEHRDARIAILLTARSHAPPIVAALKAAGITVAGVDLVALADLPVVRDLQALTRALHHLGDRTAWLAVLRAPWCGLTLRELSVLSERVPQQLVWEALNDAVTVEQLTPATRARLVRTRSALEETLAHRDRMKPAAWVEAAWLRLGGPAACASDSDLEHASAFFERLARWSAEPGWGGPLSIDGRLEELYASHEQAADAVQIMTIHRAKGLEFDHVVLPGLGRRLRSSPEPLLRWLELPRDREGSDLLLAPIPPLGRRGTPPLGEYLKSLQARRANHERVRLLYVAATRAREQLHLFGDLPASGAMHGTHRAEPTPRAGTLLAALWPAVAGEFPRVEDSAERAGALASGAGASAAAGETSERAPRGSLVRLAAGWHLPELAAAPAIEGGPRASSEPESPADGIRVDARTVSLVPEPEQAVESAVCAQLRGYARRGRLPALGSPTIMRALRDGLTRLGLDGEELEEQVQRAMSLWHACLADSALQWIFSPRHTGAAGAFEMSGLYAGRIEMLTVDRVFVDDEGVCWLVNFRPASAMAPRGSATQGLRGVAAEIEKAVALGRALGTRLGGAQRVRGGVYVPSLQVFRAAT